VASSSGTGAGAMAGVQHRRVHAHRWACACLVAVVLARVQSRGAFTASAVRRPLVARAARSGQEESSAGSPAEPRSTGGKEEVRARSPRGRGAAWAPRGQPFPGVRVDVGGNETTVVLELDLGIGLGLNLEPGESNQTPAWQQPEVNSFTNWRIMDCIDGNCTVDTLEELDGKLARDEKRIELIIEDLQDEERKAHSPDIAERLDWFRTFLDSFHELRQKLHGAMSGAAPAW